MDVTLRRVRPRDRDAFMAWFRDPSLTRWHGDPGPCECDAEFQRIVGSRYNFVIEAGGASVGPLPWNAIGTMPRPPSWGFSWNRNQCRGIGQIALAQAIDFAFEEAGATRLWAGVVSSNAAALRLCKRVGLAEEKRVPVAELDNDHWIDHVYFSVLSEEWRRIQPVPKT